MIIDREITVILEINVRIWLDYEPYVPARVRADPDDSYPAEGGTVSIYKIVRLGPGDKEEEEIILPAFALEALEEEIYEELAE